MFEAGVEDRWATLRVSRAKKKPFSILNTFQSQTRKYVGAAPKPENKCGVWPGSSVTQTHPWGAGRPALKGPVVAQPRT